MTKSKQLTWTCLYQVLTFSRQAADDIRLNVQLFQRCLNDQRKFCGDVEPGHMRVQVCVIHARLRLGAAVRCGRGCGLRLWLGAAASGAELPWLWRRLRRPCAANHC